MRNSRSPLKDRPLRNPGQSLDEQIRDLIETNIAGPVFLAMFAVLVAVLEWWRYYHPAPPSPRIYYFAAVIVIVYAAFRVYWTLPRLRALKLGRDGEKAVGQFLERLRERGYRVFHDLIGNGFNIDHVLIEGLFRRSDIGQRGYRRRICHGPAAAVDAPGPIERHISSRRRGISD